MTPRRHRVASDAGIGTTFSDRQSRARGFALFIVLWFLVLIAAIGTYVLANARSETALARNILAGAHAEALADSGIAQVVFNLTDTDPTKQWALDGTAYRVLLSDGAVTIRLGDETEKINPNLASRPLMAALFEALGIVPSDAAQLAASIVDWTHPLPKTADPNDDRKPYQAAGLDYGPPHRPIPSLDELSFVLGMTPEILRSARPYLSLYTGGDPPDPRNAPEIIQRALAIAADGTIQDTSQANGAASPASTNNAAAPPAAPSIVAVEATGRSNDGGIFVRHAVIQIDPDLPAGYDVLAWERGDVAP